MHVIKNKKYLIDFVCIVFIFIICLWNLGELSRIKIVDDEFGYWGIAAMINGFEWSDLMAVTEYYSFGYSIILVPLLFLNRLGVAMPVIYKLAIILNACFLAGVYCLVQYVVKKVFQDLPETLMQAAALFISLYIGYSSRVHSAWSETYLLFMFWCVIALFIRFIEKPDCRNVVFLLLSTFNIFAIHMRALGVVVAVAMALVCYFIGNRKKIDKRCILLTLVLTVVLIVGFNVVKEYVTACMYSNQGSTSVNDIPKQMDRAKSILSLFGMIDFAMSIVSKLYYAGAASFLFTLIGFVYALLHMTYMGIMLIRKKMEGKSLTEWYYFFALLAFLGELAVACIFNCIKFFSNGATKALYMDSIVYGRYLDFAAGPMILLGIWAVYHIADHYRELLIAATLFFLGAAIAQYQIDILAFYGETSVKGFRSAASPWLSLLYQGNLSYFIYYAGSISVFIFLVVILISTIIRKKTGLTVAIMLVGIFSGLCGFYVSSEYIESKEGKEKTVATVEQIMAVTDEDIPIYLVSWEKNDAFTDVKILQWCLGQRPIHMIPYAELENIETEQTILLCDSSDNRMRGRLSDLSDYLYDSGTISVFVNRRNKYYDILEEKAEEMAQTVNPIENQVDLQSIITDLSYVKANGSLYYNYQASDGGYMTEGMGVNLEDGVYEFSLDIRAKQCTPGSEIGYITSGDTMGNVQDRIVLYADDFIKKERQVVTARVKIADGKEPFIGLYVYGEAAVRVYNISYQKIIGNISLASDEIEDVVSFIDKEQNTGKVYYIDSDNSAVTGFPAYDKLALCYLPGEIVSFKEKLDGKYYIVEKTDNEVLGIFKRELEQIYANNTYIVFEGRTGDKGQ